LVFNCRCKVQFSDFVAQEHLFYANYHALRMKNENDSTRNGPAEVSKNLAESEYRSENNFDWIIKIIM